MEKKDVLYIGGEWVTPAGGKIGEKKAGMLPYVTLAAGVVVAAAGYFIFWT